MATALAGISTEIPIAATIKDADTAMQQVQTEFGPLNVFVEGDPATQPIMMTYHDVGLDHRACFQGFFSFHEAQRIANKMCIIHIDAPGQTPGSPLWPAEKPYLTVDQLADQIESVCIHFKIRKFVGLGAGAGGRIMMEFAMGYPQRLQGLVMIGVTFFAPGYYEWGWSKVSRWFSWMSGKFTPLATETLMQRYFSPDTLNTKTDLVEAFRDHVTNRMQSENVQAFMTTLENREDLWTPLVGEELPDRKHNGLPDTLIIYGSHSHDVDGAENGFIRFNPAKLSRIQVWGCGDMVHEEMPDKVARPIILFLEGLGILFR